MTKLISKITNKLNIPNPKGCLDLNYFLVGVLYEQIHPIDYLYEEFKKLKQ
jgi:hypothetical protein